MRRSGLALKLLHFRRHRRHRRRRDHFAARTYRRRQELGLPLHVGPGLLVHRRRPDQARPARGGPGRGHVRCCAASARPRPTCMSSTPSTATYPTPSSDAGRARLPRQPTRSGPGNGAATQTQLGTFGDLSTPIWHYVQRRPPARPANRTAAGRPRRPVLRHLAHARTPASGSCQTDRHYTISKMGCWVALDRAVRLARRRARSRPATPTVAHANATRSRSWVNEHCWSPSQAVVHLLRRHR